MSLRLKCHERKTKLCIFTLFKIKRDFTDIHVNNLFGSFVSLANRLSDFYIRVGNDFDENSFDPSTFTECWYQPTALGEGEIRQFTCSQVILGLYVVVHFPTSKVERLTLCEVEVFSDIGKT